MYKRHARGRGIDDAAVMVKGDSQGAATGNQQAGDGGTLLLVSGDQAAEVIV